MTGNKNKVKLKDIQELSDKFEKVGNQNLELFTKALFMYVRGIEDEDMLDDMWDVYDTKDISLINDLIVEKTY